MNRHFVLRHNFFAAAVYHCIFAALRLNGQWACLERNGLQSRTAAARCVSGAMLVAAAGVSAAIPCMAFASGESSIYAACSIYACNGGAPWSRSRAMAVGCCCCGYCAVSGILPMTSMGRCCRCWWRSLDRCQGAIVALCPSTDAARDSAFASFDRQVWTLHWCILSISSTNFDSTQFLAAEINFRSSKARWRMLIP